MLYGTEGIIITSSDEENWYWLHSTRGGSHMFNRSLEELTGLPIEELAEILGERNHHLEEEIRINSTGYRKAIQKAYKEEQRLKKVNAG